MTDNEIIKALECCKNSLIGDLCDNCPLVREVCCKRNLYGYALDLIKRQQTENEELREVIDDMSSYFPCCTNCEGKVDGLFNDKCINLINHEFCAKKGLENIAQILRENEEQKAENERLKTRLVGKDIIIDNLDEEIDRLIAVIEKLKGKKNKCGTCAYAKPTTFGKSKCYVECTNQEHIQKFCKREISLKRQRTTPACGDYKEMTE